MDSPGAKIAVNKPPRRQPVFDDKALWILSLALGGCMGSAVWVLVIAAVSR